MPASRNRRAAPATPGGVPFDLYGTLVSAGATSARKAVMREMAVELGAEPDAFVAAVRDSFDEADRDDHDVAFSGEAIGHLADLLSLLGPAAPAGQTAREGDAAERLR